ncbi:DUF6114 domain-containing protein [Halobacteriales archaeon Cl-PHB]
MLATLTRTRSRFADWRQDRPFWGGVTLTLAGLVIGIIPLDLALKFALIPTTFAFVGLVFAVVVVLCGVFAVLQPQFSSFFGAAGMVVSVASMFGALGGFGIGTILGIVGGSLCVAWVHPDEVEDEEELALDVSSKVTTAKASVLTLLR